jgi:hypothetical protein
MLIARYRFRQAIRSSPARFHFHKDQIMLIFSNKIDFSIAAAKIAL